MKYSKAVIPVLLLSLIATGCGAQAESTAGKGIQQPTVLNPESFCGVLDITGKEVQVFTYNLSKFTSTYLTGLTAIQSTNEFADANLRNSWLRIEPDINSANIYIKDENGNWVWHGTIFSAMGVEGETVIPYGEYGVLVKMDENYNLTLKLAQDGCLTESHVSND